MAKSAFTTKFSYEKCENIFRVFNGQECTNFSEIPPDINRLVIDIEYEDDAFEYYLNQKYPNKLNRKYKAIFEKKFDHNLFYALGSLVNLEALTLICLQIPSSTDWIRPLSNLKRLELVGCGVEMEWLQCVERIFPKCDIWGAKYDEGDCYFISQSARDRMKSITWPQTLL